MINGPFGPVGTGVAILRMRHAELPYGSNELKCNGAGACLLSSFKRSAKPERRKDKT
jgi:hypothetical protein